VDAELVETQDKHQEEEEEEEEEEDEEEEYFHTLDKEYQRSSNMHIIFPNLIVDAKQAIIMAKAIACHLHDLIGERANLAKGWSDVVDPSVYLRNGLRMIGSRKCRKCKRCQKNNNNCIHCDGGYIDLGKVYKLRWVLNDLRVYSEHASLHNTAVMMQMCSIRQPYATASTDGWCRYIGCPSVDEKMIINYEAEQKRIMQNVNHMTQSRRKQKMDGLRTPNVHIFSEDRESMKGQARLHVEIGRNEAIFAEIEKLVHTFAACYSKCMVRSIRTTPKRRYYRVCIMGQGSTVCHNLTADKTEHYSNTVYFIIKPSGMSQSCWCTCNTVQHRKNGLCKDYKSPKKPISRTSRLLLFPFMMEKRSRGRAFFGGVLPRNMSIDSKDALEQMQAYFQFEGFEVPKISTKKRKRV
jgi:hypothetical protein